MKCSSSLTIRCCSTTRKYVKGHRFFSFAGKYKKQFLDTGIDTLKFASEKLVHETGGFIGNKVADTVTKLNNAKIVKREPVQELLFYQKKEMKY